MNYRVFFKYFFVFLFFTVITLFFFQHRVEVIDSSYGLPGVDTDTTLWLQWLKSELPNAKFYHSNYISYPLPFNLLPILTTESLIYDVHILVLNIIGFSVSNLVLVTNISTLLVYPLTGLFMFLLLRKLGISNLSSFLGSASFAFSYYIVLMARGSLAHNHIEFIPLFFYFFISFLQKPRWLSIFAASAVLIIISWINLYWFFFTFITSLLFFIVYVLITKKNRKFFFSGFFFFVASALITLLFNFRLFYLVFFTNNFTSFSASRNINMFSELQNIGEFFFPPYFQSITGNSVYIGLVELIVVVGIVLFFTNKIEKKALTSFIVCILLVAFCTTLFYWTNLQDLYSFFFGMFRAIHRLNIFISFFLAISFAFSFDFIRKKLSLPLTMFIFIILLPLVIFQNVPMDLTWYDTHNLVEREIVFQQLPDVEAFGILPLSSPKFFGFPDRTFLLDQVLHGRKISSSYLEDFIQNEKINFSLFYKWLEEANINHVLIYSDLMNQNQIDSLLGEASSIERYSFNYSSGERFTSIERIRSFYFLGFNNTKTKAIAKNHVPLEPKIYYWLKYLQYILFAFYLFIIARKLLAENISRSSE